MLMWCEVCESMREDSKIDFLEAVEYMTKGRFCKDFEGATYRIKNRKFEHRSCYNWIPCYNYQVPTETEWELVKEDLT
ncbi:MAG: hypothetical protein RSD47_00715 [Romboutsia sp.]